MRPLIDLQSVSVNMPGNNEGTAQKKEGILLSPLRMSGWILGLIFGRSCGLACVELTLGRFRLDIEDLDGSDLFGTGPLGDGMATARGLRTTEPPGVCSAGVSRGSNDGVTLAEIAGLAVPMCTAVSMRLTLGRG